MDKNRYFQIRSGKYIKTKVADIQRLYSKWLWLVIAVYKLLLADAENVVLCYVADIQFVIVIENMLGDELGTEFCWPKEKKSKYKIAFTPYWRLCLPKI